MSMIPYCGFERPDPPPAPTDVDGEIAAAVADGVRHVRGLEREIEHLHAEIRALRSALGIACRVLAPYYVPAKSTHQR